MMIRQLRSTRRSFLQGVAAAGYPVLRVAAPWVIPASALGGEGRPAPSNRITVGAVGVGGQGGQDMNNFPDSQVVAVCDVDGRKRERLGKEGRKAYLDFRELCARPDIDVVSCGTPDHWHAQVCCEAMRNGKDVFCQKPETLTIREGRVLVETARRYGRVYSGGSQRVWDDYHRHHRMLWAGTIGEVKEVFVDIGEPAGEMRRPAEPAPEWLDWDLWLGPAPWRPYHPDYHPGRWRGCRDFSGGSTDGGAHVVGGALFAAQWHDKPHPVEARFPGDDNPDRCILFRYADGRVLHAGGGWGQVWGGHFGFKGPLGEFPDRRGSRIAPPEIDIPSYKGGRTIYADFIHCVKTRERPFRDVQRAHRTMVVLHLANIANWVGRSLKFDPAKEEIVGDEEANRWIDRPRRAPWVLEA